MSKKPKKTITREELKAEILKYISKHSKDSEIPNPFLKEDNIIKNMKDLYDTTDDEIEELLSELEVDDDKIEETEIEINYNNYVIKSKSEEFKKKLKDKGLLPTITSGKLIVLSLFTLGILVYFLYKPDVTAFKTIEEANKNGVITGVILSFFSIAFFNSIFSGIIEKIYKKKDWFVMENIFNLVLIILTLVGILGFTLKIDILWEFSLFLVTIMGVIKFTKKK